MKQHFLRALWTVAFSTALLAQSPTRYRIDTVAGTTNVYDGGAATSAILNNPIAVLADDKGGFYFAEASRYRVRYVAANGTIRTLAGNGIAGRLREGVPATESPVYFVTSIALASNGDVYFADPDSCQIARIDAAGTLRRVAGTGACGFAGDRGPATAAQLNGPQGILFDNQGRLLIADTNNHRIRRINADGNIETIAGNGSFQTFGADGTDALATPISYPTGLAIAADGTLYYVEFGYRRVRLLTPEGKARTVAGTGFAGNTGDGGPATQARFQTPRRISLDGPRGLLYIPDEGTNRVRRVTLSTGIISNAVGITFTSAIVFANSFSGDGGPGSNAGLASPDSVSVDSSGALFIADTVNQRVRKSDATIRTVAGRFPNTADGPAIRAELLSANNLALTKTGEVLVSDSGNGIIRRIAGTGTTILAGTPNEKLPANTAAAARGDGGAATAAGFASLVALAIDGSGSIFINDNGRLRRIDGATINAVGTGAAGLLPTGAGNFFADTTRNRLYLAVPSANKILVADTTQALPVFRDFAGTGTAGFSGDGSAATSAQLNNPRDVAVDEAGNVYIADAGRIRRVTPAGIISTVAGSGAAITVAVTTAETNALTTPIAPVSLTLDPAGRLTFVELGNSEYIRQLDLTSGRIRSIAGSGVRGNTGDGGLALAGRIYAPRFIRSDASGNLFFLDAGDPVLRVLRPFTLSRIEVASGADQSAPVSTKLANPITVRVAASDGPVAGLTVNFTAPAGVTITPAAAVTDSLGLARAEVTLGSTAGPVVITAAVDGLPSVSIRATATVAVVVNPNRPALSTTGGVATAGAFGGEALISPGTWIELYGTNLATTTRSWGGDDFRGAQAPTELDGVKVTIGGRAAYVAFISPTQINAQVPDGVPAGPVTVTVTNSNGTSEAATVTAAAASPALLAPPVFNIGGVQYVVALHQDGAFVGREGAIPGANFRPAKAGDIITLYGVGFGPTSPAVAAGQVTGAPSALPGVRARLGDADASVLFGGLAPGAVGLYQFNLTVPEGVSGDVPLVLSTSATTSKQNLRLTVQ